MSEQSGAMPAQSLAMPASNSGRRGRFFRNNPTLWLSLTIQALLIVLIAPPVFLLLLGTFTETLPDGSYGALTLDNFRELLQGSHLYKSLVNSLIFATLATLLSLLIGMMLAWVVERTDTPLKPLAYLTTIISMGTPYILYVTAWLFLFGRVGPFNDLYRLLTGSTESLFQINSMWGMVVIEGFLWSPLVFLMLTATFRAANAEMEEAARMSGATILQTIRRVSMPLTRPAVLALALFVFIRNIEAFDVPALVGTPGRISVLTTEVYNNIKQVPPRVGLASAFSSIMLVIVGVLLYFYSKISKSADKYASVTGKGYRPRPFRLGRARWLGGAFIILNFLIILGLPMIALVWSSLMPYARAIRPEAFELATLKNYQAVFTSSYYIDYAVRTIFISAVAASGIIVITVIGGWLAARRHPGGGLIDQLATAPLVFPGIVLGMTMLEVAIRAPFPLYGTIWVIGLAFIIRYLPYGMRYSYSGTLQIHRELEEAAGVAGASTLDVLRRVVVPLLSPAILSGWLFIFLLAAKELSISLLLAGPNSQTIAVAMFELWGNGQSGELSAFGLIWTAFMTVCASAFYFLTRRSASGAFAH